MSKKKLSSPEVYDAFTKSVGSEIGNVEEAVAQMESEADIQDYMSSLSALAKRAGLDTKSAEELASARTEELRLTFVEYTNPEFPDAPKSQSDFDDLQLQNLFASLLS